MSGNRKLFLSAVSCEFLAYRELLAKDLKRPALDAAVQEDFNVTGGSTLEKLDDYIRACDGGQGVCLGIKVLKEEIRDERWPNLARASQRVLYDEGRWTSLLEKAFRNVLEEFTEYINANGHDFAGANSATWSALSRIAAYAAIGVKQPSWAPEEEWRQAAFSGPHDVATPLIRDAKGADVRYLALRMRTEPLRLAFSEILLGPRCHADEETTKRILVEAGYSAQEIPPIATSTVSE
jgi:hypothetical protein